MDVLLVHNPTAGRQNPDGEEIVGVLKASGHTVSYRLSDDPGWEDELRCWPRDRVVVIAGGDGTVRKVFRNLAASAEEGVLIPAAVLPLGTANNIARSLGLGSDWRHLCGGLEQSDLGRFECHRITVGDNTDWVFESAGIGVFAEFIRMAAIHPNRIDLISTGQQGRARDDSSLAWLAARSEPFRLILDARDTAISGSFLLAEAMNIPGIGRGIEMGSSESMLPDTTELVLVPESRRGELVDYFEQRAQNVCVPFPATRQVVRGPMILTGEFGPVYHVDDEGSEWDADYLPPILLRRSSAPLHIRCPGLPG